MSLGAGSGPQLMDLDVCPRDAVTAESLAALLTCAELQVLLGLHMPPCEVDLVEDALALRHESFLNSLPASMQPSSTPLAAQPPLRAAALLRAAVDPPRPRPLHAALPGLRWQHAGSGL